MVLMPLEGDVLARDMSEARIKESLAQYVVIVVARTPASTAGLLIRVLLPRLCH